MIVKTTFITLNEKQSKTHIGRGALLFSERTGIVKGGNGRQNYQISNVHFMNLSKNKITYKLQINE